MAEEEHDERGFLGEMHLKPMKAAKPPQPDHVGHRQRLRERFASAGTAGMPDYEFLELLLFRSIPRADTKPIAKALIKRFGTLAEVLGAPIELLQEVNGVGPSVALDLKIIAAAGTTLARGGVNAREVLSSWTKVVEYCRTAMAFEAREQFRILFLDKKNALIADEVQQTGTVDHTPVYPREVVHRALNLGATAVILAHNHPSGDPTPSRADIDMTRQIAEAGKPLGITVHDHIIIGRKSHCSMKALQLF